MLCLSRYDPYNRDCIPHTHTHPVAAMSYPGWTAASASLFTLPFFFWMVYTDLVDRYPFETAIVAPYALAQIYFNVCWNNASQYCPTGAAESATASLVLNNLTTFMALVALAPLVREWWLSHLQTRFRGRIYFAFLLVFTCLTFVLVTHFGRDLPASITLPSVMGVAVFYAYFCEVRNKERGHHGWWWMARFWSGVALLTLGFVFQALANSREFNGALTLQTDAYNMYMFFSNLLLGLGLSTTSTCIGNGPELSAYSGVPTKQPSGPSKSGKAVVTF